MSRRRSTCGWRAYCSFALETELYSSSTQPNTASFSEWRQSQHGRKPLRWWHTLDASSSLIYLRLLSRRVLSHTLHPHRKVLRSTKLLARQVRTDSRDCNRVLFCVWIHPVLGRAAFENWIREAKKNFQLSDLQTCENHFLSLPLRSERAGRW